MKYIKNNTQEGKILNLLREKGSAGVYVYELQAPRPQGLGIAQYNARIWGLRRKGFVIKNTTPGHFVLDELSSSTNSNPSQVTTEPQFHACDPENCHIDEHYYDYYKDNRRYSKHKEDVRQEAML